MSIRPGSILRNDDLQTTFLCSSQGGMRRSLRTNTLVLISDHTKSLYEDRWEGKIFHYTGMGKVGDQDLYYSQNRTVLESKSNGVEVHLFEVFIETQYVYIGKVQLAGDPYQEQQLDEEQNLRKVWVFPLVSIERRPLISRSLIDAKTQEREKLAKKLSDVDLAKRAFHSGKKATQRQASALVFERNPFVTEFAKRWAIGICQLCENPAPFQNKKGEPHLHTHHIEWLSRGGEDSIENTIALCPNCHDRMHILDNSTDVAKLKNKVTRHLHTHRSDSLQ